MSGDRLAQIEKRAIDALDTNGYGFGYEHMGDMWRDMEPLCRDVLALVEIAEAARDVVSNVNLAGRNHFTHELEQALARLDSGATE